MRNPRTTLPRRLLLLVCLAAGVALTSCGGGGADEKRVPVSGKVTLGTGQPLTTGSVRFVPDAAKGNASKYEYIGQLNERGEYTLAGHDGISGAPVGWYKVAVVATKPNPTGEYAPPQWLINPRYGDPSTSGIAIQVVENPAPGAYDVTVGP